jgi:hypothetical protein
VRLIQEDYLDDPWRVLVCCVLLNRTNGHQQTVHVLPELFRRWPTAAAMGDAPAEEIADLIRPLGFQNRRSRVLGMLSRAWDLSPARTRDMVECMPGVGKYAADAFALLCLGESADPEDKELRRWLADRGGRPLGGNVQRTVKLDHDSRLSLKRQINAAVRVKRGMCQRCGLRECEPSCGRSSEKKGKSTRRWTDVEIVDAVRDVARRNGRETISRNLYEQLRDPSLHPSSATVSTRVGTQLAFKEG